MKEFLKNLFKLVFAIILLPIVITCANNFTEHFSNYPNNYDEFFLWGAFSFLMIFLFVYEFWGIHEFGQRIISGIFKFITSPDGFISKIISFYLILIFIVFFFTNTFLEVDKYDHYFLFFIGFASAMHIILVAQDLQQEEKSLIKPTYLFTMTVILIFNICLIILCMDVVLKSYTFADFFQSVVTDSKDIAVRLIRMVK